MPLLSVAYRSLELPSNSSIANVAHSLVCIGLQLSSGVGRLQHTGCAIMAENKTKLTALSSAAYIAAIADPVRRQDCTELSRLMAKASKEKPRMWGAAIVGFGVHRYPLAGGKQGEICSVGFSSRKGDISIYGVAGEGTDPGLLAKLGKHKRGKGCLYISRLSDVNLDVLEEMVVGAMRRKQT